MFLFMLHFASDFSRSDQLSIMKQLSKRELCSVGSKSISRFSVKLHQMRDSNQTINILTGKLYNHSYNRPLRYT